MSREMNCHLNNEICNDTSNRIEVLKGKQTFCKEKKMVLTGVFQTLLFQKKRKRIKNDFKYFESIFVETRKILFQYLS